MDSSQRNRYLIGLIAVAAAVIALLILPFVGFTEKTVYWNSYEMVGLGTWADGLNFFDYPDTLFYIALLLLAGAVALIGPLRLLWGAYRLEEEPPKADLSRAAAISGTVAVGTVAVLPLTLLVLLPSVEEQTIWLVEAGGFLSDWWPSYGAFIAIGGAAIAAWALRSAANASVPPPPPPPPPNPAV